MSPLISIITVVFNGEKTLSGTIESVLTQDYKNFEYILIDGASTDKSVSIIHKYACPSIKYISEPDLGIYDAMNKGINLAEGRWIYFLGADDTFHNSKVLNKIFSSKNIANYDVIYANVFLKYSNKIFGGSFNEKRLMGQNICHQSIFYRNTLFQKYGKFNLKYPILADWEFNMRWFGDASIRRLYLNVVVANYDETGSSSCKSDENFQKDYWLLLLKNFSHLDKIVFLFWQKIFRKLLKECGFK